MQTILHGSDKSWIIEKPAGSLEQQDITLEGHDLTPNPRLAVLAQGTFPDPWEGKSVPHWMGDTDSTAAAPPPVSPAPGNAAGEERADWSLLQLSRREEWRRADRHRRTNSQVRERQNRRQCGRGLRDGWGGVKTDS